VTVCGQESLVTLNTTTKNIVLAISNDTTGVNMIPWSNITGYFSFTPGLNSHDHCGNGLNSTYELFAD